MRRKIKYSTTISLVIIGLVIAFSLFIVFTVSGRRTDASSAGAPAGQAASGAGQQSGGAAGGQAASAGGQQSGGAAAGQAASGTRQQSGGAAAGQAASGTGQRTQTGTTGQTAAARNATVVRATPVQIGTIENSLIINGDVLSSSQVSVVPSVAGKITSLPVRVGDTVRRGQTVAVVDPSRPGDFYNPSPIASTVAGTVLQVPVNLGDTVGTSTAVVVVGDTSGSLVETFVPERFSVVTKTGMTATVSFEAMPGETFAATVNELSPVLDPASRTLKIHLRFTKTDSRIRPGMFATISLVVGSHENVMVIPRASVINTYGTWIVFVVKSSGIAGRREVQIGLENEQFIEVTGGLEPGEMVVTAGQMFLTDGDLVRVVD
jgi:multidrug efflux pump subunit AcrA (membrane-fusion protein)